MWFEEEAEPLLGHAAAVGVFARSCFDLGAESRKFYREFESRSKRQSVSEDANGLLVLGGCMERQLGCEHVADLPWTQGWRGRGDVCALMPREIATKSTN